MGVHVAATDMGGRTVIAVIFMIAAMLVMAAIVLFIASVIDEKRLNALFQLDKARLRSKRIVDLLMTGWNWLYVFVISAGIAGVLLILIESLRHESLARTLFWMVGTGIFLQWVISTLFSRVFFDEAKSSLISMLLISMFACLALAPALMLAPLVIFTQMLAGEPHYPVMIMVETFPLLIAYYILAYAICQLVRVIAARHILQRVIVLPSEREIQ